MGCGCGGSTPPAGVTAAERRAAGQQVGGGAPVQVGGGPGEQGYTWDGPVRQAPAEPVAAK